MSTITFTPLDGSAQVMVTPTLVLGYETSRESGNIVHDILGREDPVVTLRPAKLRTGTLNLGFETESEAMLCSDTHARLGTFRFDDGDLESVGMNYVVAGRISPALEDETRAAWIVAVEYQEVASS